MTTVLMFQTILQSTSLCDMLELYNHPKYTVRVFWQPSALKTLTGKTLKNLAFGDSGSYKS